MPLIANPLRAELAADGHGPRAIEFHRRLPDYAPTPLRALPGLAEVLGLGDVLVKDESRRLGLPSFKMLGASWAAYRALVAQLGRDVEPWRTVDELRARLSRLSGLTLATATDGNHGRAVARVARLLGLQARIWVPANTAAARIAAIESEGAVVEITDGGYNDAVREAASAARFASERTVLVSDTTSDACTREPRWVIEGYSTMFQEIDQQLTELRFPSPDIVVVPVGVGALAASAVVHFRRRPRRTILIGAEPTTAACVGASLAAGHPLELPGVQDSIMAGLNCASPSLVAWPFVSAGLDFLATVEDDQARQAMRDFAAHGVVAGESGAASLAGLGEALADLREAGAVDGGTTALLISTEGATDPQAYATVVGCSADEVATAA